MITGYDCGYQTPVDHSLMRGSDLTDVERALLKTLFSDCARHVSQWRRDGQSIKTAARCLQGVGMKSLGANLSIAICGLVTSILVAIANVAISNIVGFNLFTFNIWFIIPAGALAVGAAAASGYYFGALFFHKRPSALLLVQMVIIAAFSQFLIYYLEYTTLIIDGQKVSDFVPFEQYLDISLTSPIIALGVEWELILAK